MSPHEELIMKINTDASKFVSGIQSLIREVTNIDNNTEPVPQVTSSPCPPFHLIPTIALERLAQRFQAGNDRKGKGAWNALSDNQECLTDKDLLIERISHSIKHAMILRDKLAKEDWDAIKSDDDAAAIMWAGAFAICAIDELRKQREGSGDE